MKKLLIIYSFALLVLAAFSTQARAHRIGTNANASITQDPSDGEITTTVENGFTIQTRTFKDDKRISRVVVTTAPDGTKTARVYNRRGAARDLSPSAVDSALAMNADALADASGFANEPKDVADVTKEAAKDVKQDTKKAADKTVEGAKTVADDTAKVAEKTADTSKTAAEKTADTSKKVGEKTADTSKEVGKTTAKGASRIGRAFKKIFGS
jgi:hypothetical protein